MASKEQSSSGDDDSFLETSHIILPYQFEPSYSKEEVERRRNKGEAVQRTAISEPGESSSTRSGDNFWCTCTKCPIMPTELECICCHEVGAAQKIVDEFDPEPEDIDTDLPNTCALYQQKCVTLHPDFVAHLNKAVLDTYFRSHQYNWRKFPKPEGPGGTLTNAQYRLVSYRFILDWLLKGERLGKKKRIPLPACVVGAIRTIFPADDNAYVGFKYAELPTL